MTAVLGQAVDDACLYGSLALLALYAVLCCVPFLHNAVRTALRPTVLRLVDDGLSTVEWAQSFQRNWLTQAFNASAHTVSVSFYITVLPFCIWIFGESLGWRLCFLMTATLFVGNSLKDLFCGPRPFTAAAARAKAAANGNGTAAATIASGAKGKAKGKRKASSGRTTTRMSDRDRCGSAGDVSRSSSSSDLGSSSADEGDLSGTAVPGSGSGEAASNASFGNNGNNGNNGNATGGPVLMASQDSEDFQVHAREYGLPSSHTMNTLALNLYIVHYVSRAAQLSPWASAALHAAAWAWVGWIAFSRMYLGFHTPVDIAVGGLYGAAVLCVYSRVDDAVDAWLMTSSRFSGLEVLAVAVLLMRAHPRPLAYTPSFEYSVSFMGVTFGIAAALRRTAPLIPYMQQAPPLLTLWGAFFCVRRLLTGFVVLFVMKEACKSSLLGVLPSVYRLFPMRVRALWQPPLVSLCACQGTPACAHRHAPVNAKGHPCDADVTARFLSYASIGWAVVEIAPRMFKALGW